MSKEKETVKSRLTAMNSRESHCSFGRKWKKNPAKGIFWKLQNLACKEKMQEILQLYES